MKYWFRRKWFQVKRVIDFLPIIWKGYDFDFRYALDLFKHQLERQAKFMDSDKAVSLEAKQGAKEIRRFICLMDKVYEEEYALEYQSKLEELYGKCTSEFVPIEGTDYFTWEMTYENQTDETEEMHRKLFLESNEKQKKAHRILWSYLEHKIWGWWD